MVKLYHHFWGNARGKSGDFFSGASQNAKVSARWNGDHYNYQFSNSHPQGKEVGRVFFHLFLFCNLKDIATALAMSTGSRTEFYGWEIILFLVE